MNLNKYMKSIKNKKNLKPCIKHYNKDEIKINEEYKDAENLSEKDIIPDLYKEEDEDIKSLEKSLESSIDKSFDKKYERIYKIYAQSCNDKYNNDGLHYLNSHLKETNKNQLKKIQEEFIEEEVYEENEQKEKNEYQKKEENDNLDIKEIILTDNEDE